MSNSNPHHELIDEEHGIDENQNNSPNSVHIALPRSSVDNESSYSDYSGFSSSQYSRSRDVTITRPQ